MTTEPHHAFVEANGVRFHYAEQGEGPLVLLLHGFPECWYSWRHQIAALAPRFRVVAAVETDLKVYVPHLRRVELEQIAAATGAEVVYLTRSEQAGEPERGRGGGQHRRHRRQEMD